MTPNCESVKVLWTFACRDHLRRFFHRESMCHDTQRHDGWACYLVSVKGRYWSNLAWTMIKDKGNRRENQILHVHSSPFAAISIWASKVAIVQAKTNWRGEHCPGLVYWRFLKSEILHPTSHIKFVKKSWEFYFLLHWRRKIIHVPAVLIKEQ